MDLLGIAPVEKRKSPETIAKAEARRSAPRNKAYDDAYELRRMSDPVLRQRYECRQQTQALVSAGFIRRNPCEVCGDTDVDLHHTNYNDPYAVISLCRRCHARHEGKTRRDERRRSRRTSRHD